MPPTPQEWTLLVLAEAGGIVTPVQLQKALFLIGDNLKLGHSFYQFAPYDYGPFCKAIYSDAERLQEQGLVQIVNDRWVGREYTTTPEGLQRAVGVREQLTAEQKSYLSRVVPWVRQRSFKELVMSIYEAYPDMRANSVFRY